MEIFPPFAVNPKPLHSATLILDHVKKLIIHSIVNVFKDRSLF